MTAPGLPTDEALPRILLDSIQDEAVFALDAAGVVVSWNSGAERITGYTGEEARGKHVSLFYPDDEVQLGAPGRELRRAERAGSVEVEGWWVRKDGTRLWISATTRVLRDTEGQVAGYARVGRDVTERLRAEEALRLSEARFSGIVSIASDAIVSVDESQRIVLFNQGAEQIFGYTAREAIGEPLDLLIPARSRESHRGHLAGFGAGRGHAARRMGERQEIFGVRKNGEEFPAEASISRLELGGRMLFTAVLRDVTERKEAERRIAELLAAEQTARAAAETAERRTRVLAEAGALLTASLDYGTTLRTLARLAVPTLADGCTVYLKDDDGAVRLFQLGMEDADTAARVADLRSGPLAGALHPALGVVTTGRSVLVDPVPDALLAGLAESDAHLELLRGLDLRTLMVVPIALRGEAMGALGFVTIGERPGFTRADVALAEELGRRAGLAIENARLYRAAQDAVRARDDVLGIVSHDLGNSLSAVAVASAVLLRTLPEDAPGDARARAASIRQLAEQMQRLRQDLLDVASVEAGRLAVEPEVHDARALLEESVHHFAPLAAERDIALDLAAADDVPPVDADRERFLQVMGNLLANALKFTLPGGRIRASVSEVEEGVCFQVTDTGAGIDPEHLPHIFDRYWRTQGGNRHGAGLGLAISRGIVEAHGGRIWAESTPGEGSTFRFTLPRARLLPDDAGPHPVE